MGILSFNLRKKGGVKIFLTLLLLGLGTDSFPQYFGMNKPKYEKDEARLLETPHFELYHYLTNDSVARRLGEWHEWWYRKHSIVLEDTFEKKNPIIFYNHHADFQQTTAIEGPIGVGTGGVTESMKNRVAMPFMETHAQTGHVIGHEMVHAFQYRMLGSIDSLGVSSITNLPLWMVEGMAEYLSLGREHPHTGLWMRDALLHDKFPTLRQMTQSNEFFPYRFGHAFWAYVTGVWGDEIIRPLFLQSAAFGYEKAMEEVIGLNENEFSLRWKDQVMAYYKGFMEDTTEITGREWFHPGNAGNMNISPVYSPDAKYMAFISDQSMLSVDILLVEVKTGLVIRKLSSGLDQLHVDDFNYVESIGTFSPDSKKFAFTVYSKGRNQIMIVDVQSGKTVEEIIIPDLEAFNFINWSPQGNLMVMSGLKEGQTDLYLYDLEKKTLVQLTNDTYSDIQPAWSPDGNFIVFVSDRETISDPNQFRLQGYNLCLLNTHSLQVEVLNIFPGADNMNPQYSVDGNMIYFLSNADGFRDLYEYSLVRNEVFRLTSYFTGITGITPWAPALTVARDNGLIAYSLFKNGKYSIYRADPADFYVIYKNSDGKSLNQDAGILPPAHSLPIIRSHHQMDSIERSFEPLKEEEFTPKGFRPKFQLDYIGNSGEINIVGGRYTTGLAGGVNALFSDILGNHQLFSALSLNGEIFDIGAQAAYINRKNPVYWGAVVSHIPYQSATSSIFQDTITLDGEEVPVINNAVDYLRTFETRIGGFSNYPLSKYHRIEGGLAMTRYHFRYDRISNYYYEGNYIGENRNRLPSPKGINVGQVNMAYVGDNSVFGTVGPLQGRRYRFDVEKYFGATNFHSILTDYRQYFRIDPLTLSLRAYHIGRYGQDVKKELLPPLFLGQPTLVRGFTGNSFNRGNVNILGDFSLNQLVGNKLMVGNLEIRLPFTGPERLSLITSKYLPSELALFVDAGMAWDQRGMVQSPSRMEEKPFVVRKPVASTGLSFRVNLLGYIVVESYYAFPWQRKLGKGVFGLNFTPAW